MATDLKSKDNSHLILWSKHVHSRIDTQGTKDFLVLKNHKLESFLHEYFQMPVYTKTL